MLDLGWGLKKKKKKIKQLTGNEERSKAELEWIFSGGKMYTGKMLY